MKHVLGLKFYFRPSVKAVRQVFTPPTPDEPVLDRPVSIPKRRTVSSRLSPPCVVSRTGTAPNGVRTRKKWNACGPNGTSDVLFIDACRTRTMSVCFFIYFFRLSLLALAVHERVFYYYKRRWTAAVFSRRALATWSPSPSGSCAHLNTTHPPTNRPEALFLVLQTV